MKDMSCKTPRWRLLKAQLNNLDPIQFKQQLDNAPSAILLDVRTYEEFCQKRLANAQHFDYLGDAFIDQMDGLDPNGTFFVYCRTGRRSIRVCTLMKNGTFDPGKIFNLDGGLSAWEDHFGLLEETTKAEK